MDWKQRIEQAKAEYQQRVIAEQKLALAKEQVDIANLEVVVTKIWNENIYPAFKILDQLKVKESLRGIMNEVWQAGEILTVPLSPKDLLKRYNINSPQDRLPSASYKLRIAYPHYSSKYDSMWDKETDKHLTVWQNFLSVVAEVENNGRTTVNIFSNKRHGDFPGEPIATINPDSQNAVEMLNDVLIKDCILREPELPYRGSIEKSVTPDIIGLVKSGYPIPEGLEYLKKMAGIV